ncbi:MAG: hypothetical protein AAF799_14825 [Myxococcota bacterium]
MPGDGQSGRLFVRRVDLGRIDLRRGAQSVAKALSEQMQALRASAVPIASARAKEAEAVFVRDSFEATALALYRASAGCSLDGWVWSRIEPSWSGCSPRQIVARAWQKLATELQAPAAMAGAVGALLDGRRLEAACDELDARDGRVLWTASQASGHRSEPTSNGGDTAEVFDPLPPVWRDSIRGLVRSWGESDARSHWVMLAALRAAHLGSTHGRVERVEALVRAYADPEIDWDAHRPWYAAGPGDEEHLGRSKREGTMVESELPEIRRVSDEEAPNADSRQVRAKLEVSERENTGGSTRTESSSGGDYEAARGVEHDSVPVEAERGQPERERFAWGAGAHPVPTACGGLWFILAILERLGIEAFIDVHPHLDGTALAARVLRRVADELEVPGDDPARVVLGIPPASDRPTPFVVPPAWLSGVETIHARWSAAAHRVVLVDSDERPLAMLTAPGSAMVSQFEDLPLYGLDHPIDALVEAWFAAVCRWLERHTEMSLAELVLRSGAVAWTRTHIDLVFDLQHTDIRVRLAMLDLDPGWVPWLGRVVAFHYVHRGVLGDG